MRRPAGRRIFYASRKAGVYDLRIKRPVIRCPLQDGAKGRMYHMTLGIAETEEDGDTSARYENQGPFSAQAKTETVEKSMNDRIWDAGEGKKALILQKSICTSH
jgi:hypothetical protein